MERAMKGCDPIGRGFLHNFFSLYMVSELKYKDKEFEKKI